MEFEFQLLTLHSAVTLNCLFFFSEAQCFHVYNEKCNFCVKLARSKVSGPTVVVQSIVPFTRAPGSCPGGWRFCDFCPADVNAFSALSSSVVYPGRLVA